MFYADSFHKKSVLRLDYLNGFVNMFYKGVFPCLYHLLKYDRFNI